ncbi:MAG: Rpn family recombination-promoting nuclease/putative transposase [Treponema sp.]|nr:Rpn family recombination-promoting nuclease/putative transposase [Treponema sp.]
MNTNRNFKDSVFTTLFSDPALLRELYCALRGVTLPPDVPVSINTLENALFMDIYNDISFKIGGKLVVLIEHQSSINPNMALRILFYVSAVYEAMVDSKTLYSTKPVSIPWPEFYVLYNGQKAFPDEKIVRLSDLFEKPQDLGLLEKILPLLDLEVRVININEGKNEAIVTRCKKLHEYSIFIAKAHAFWKESGNLEEGIKSAIKYCRKHDILNKFLELNARASKDARICVWMINFTRRGAQSKLKRQITARRL